MRAGRSVPRAPAGTDAWVRWSPVWHIGFYTVLIVATVPALLAHSWDWGRQATILGLTLLLGGWHWCLVARRPWRWLRPRPMLLYLLGALLLWISLVQLHWAYFLVAFGLYAQIFSLLPLFWAIPVSLVPTGVIFWQDLQGAPVSTSGPVVLIGVLTTASCILLAFWIDAIIGQSHDRQRLIEALEATQSELAAAERQAGMLAGRQRLAGEIHDTLAQGFTSIVLHLEAADGALPLRPRRRGATSTRRAARRARAWSRLDGWSGRCSPSRSAEHPCPRPSPAGRGVGRKRAACRPKPRSPARPIHSRRTMKSRSCVRYRKR